MIETFKALSDPCRLRLLAILLRGEFTVQELTAIIGTGQSRISHHLKILTEAGILSAKKQGTWNYYRASENNRFYSYISVAVEREMELLPDRLSDNSAVAAVLELRRRKSQEFFNLHARQWDELSRRILPLPEYKQRLLDAVPQGAKLLEIGAGTGDLLISLANIAANVVGVDNSPAMLDEARRKVAVSAITHVELRLGDMNHLPLSDNSVNCVVANMVLHHAPDPLTVIHEIRRVLMSEGLLLIADLARHDREAVREQLADQWLGFDESELAAWLTSAGFNDVHFCRIPAETGQEPVLLVTAGL